ncbi:MAG: Zn-dependent alcohol dehydrogenase [bacterium]|nr:Zn-dependent alcohol dehydrogenase [bacterium]
MRITAPVLIEAGRPMEMLELDVDDPGQGEVRVRMVASGVCHSCLHAADGSHPKVPKPIVLGDEGSGVVEKAGKGCLSLVPGDHVIISWAPVCGSCPLCHLGFPALCTNPQPFGYLFDGTTRFHHRGEDVHHYGPSTFSPYIVVPEEGAVKIRSDFPLDQAALIGCSVTTGYGAVVNTARVKAGQSVAVLGCGGIGLNAIQGAYLAGAHPIIGIDVLESKLAWAREFGATHTINSTASDVVERVREVTGPGVDVSVVAVGHPHPMEQGLHMLGPQGIEVVIGLPVPGSTFPVDPHLLIQGERRITGSRYGSGNPHVEFPKMIDLARSGHLRIGDLVTERFRPDQANQAFRSLAAGEQARGLIVF